MRIQTFAHALFFAAALVPAYSAQATSDSVQIGGPGSCSSEGSCDPGLLSDGRTVASASVLFTLDPGASTLTVVVTNTSPVEVGVPNPLLTDLFFLVPPAVTGMSLVSQSSSAGVAPSYALTFDADLASQPNPNGAGLFGSFNVALSDTGNIKGSIANPEADTYTVSAADLAVSPCTFTLALSGSLAGLTAQDFTARLSSIPPGSKPSHAVGKFQAGGVGDASAFIDQGEVCAEDGSSIVLGPGCGGTLTVTPPVPGGFSTVTYDGATPLAPALLLFSAAGGTPFPFQGCTVYLRRPSSTGGVFVTDLAGDLQHSFLVPATHHCGDEVVLQACVIDPARPAVLAETSNGVLVTMGS